MTCFSCHHSRSILGITRPVLWCALSDAPAKALCPALSMMLTHAPDQIEAMPRLGLDKPQSLAGLLESVTKRIPAPSER